MPSSSDRTSSATVHPDPSDDERSVRSESENKRDGLESSNEEDVSDFDSEKAQGIFDDWVISLPLQDRKMLSVMLMEMLQKRTALKSTAAVLEAAWITGFNEKTILVGTERSFLRMVEDSRMKREASTREPAYSMRRAFVSRQIRENAVRKGAPNLVAREFR